MNDFANQDGRALIEAMVQTIHENAAYLSQLDGAIGDGDHGIGHEAVTVVSEGVAHVA